VHDQDEVRPRRHAVALLHLGLDLDTGFERGERFGGLLREADLEDRGQSVAENLVRQDRDTPLDHARLDETPHTPQTGCGRSMCSPCQLVVGQRAIVLKQRQQPPVGRVQDGRRV
jgi:hypothetical protein